MEIIINQHLYHPKNEEDSEIITNKPVKKPHNDNNLVILVILLGLVLVGKAYAGNGRDNSTPEIKKYFVIEDENTVTYSLDTLEIKIPGVYEHVFIKKIKGQYTLLFRGKEIGRFSRSFRYQINVSKSTIKIDVLHKKKDQWLRSYDVNFENYGSGLLVNVSTHIEENKFPFN